MAAVMKQLPPNIVINYLTCAACNRIYQTPRRLPCDHVVCHVCLERRVTGVKGGVTGEWFTCPECHVTLELPVGGVKALPVQETISRFCDVIAESQVPDIMTSDLNCLQHHEARSLFCTECKTLICTR